MAADRTDLPEAYRRVLALAHQRVLASRASLTRYCGQLPGCDVDDIVQEVTVDIIRMIARGRISVTGPGELGSLIKMRCRWKVRDWAKRQAKQPVSSGSRCADVVSAPSSLSSPVKRCLKHEAMQFATSRWQAGLCPAEVRLIQMCKLGGVSYADAARELGISTAAAVMRVDRVLRKIRRNHPSLDAGA